MGKGGGGSPQPTQQTVTQTNLPEYARPYFENLLERTQAQSYQEYTPYQAERIAGFTPGEQAVQAETAGMQQPGQFGTATGLATTAGLGSLAAGQYTPAQIQTLMAQAPALAQQQMANVQAGAPQQVGVGGIQAAQTGFAPNLQAFQMAAPGQFDTAAAQQYMSPYMQNVVDVQKQEALREAQMAQNLVNLGAARQGTYGGARQLLGQTEAARNLATRLGDIQAKGLQSSYEQAQQQFERDRAAQMQAEQQNLAARLGVQELGTQTGLQTALANLTNEQQARVQSEANRLQAQGMNQETALRTALANQQAGLTAEQQNLAARLGVQELGAQQSMQAQLANQQALQQAQQLEEQSRQFGATQGLQSLAQAGQMAGMLSDIGTAGQTSQLQRLQAQAAAAGQERSMEQQRLDQAYADFLRQRDYPMEQLGYFSNILRGLPVQLGSTATTYAQPPSLASQLGGAGLGALGLYNLMK